MTVAYAKQPGIAELLIPDALNGTRTSERWNSQPGGMDRLNTRAVFPSSNEWDIPDLPRSDIRPTALAPYSSRREILAAPDGAAVHFFLDDYRFETVWTHPYRGLDRISHLGQALTPDFSIWRDMPLVMQQWQVYRSRWCGAWLLLNGIGMVPTVSWSTPKTFEFAFAGIAKGSTVAISTVGLRDSQAKRLFLAGCEALVDRVSPLTILVYGQPGLVDQILGDTDIDIQYYPTRWADGR